jgi:hypothetical protein
MNVEILNLHLASFMASYEALTLPVTDIKDLISSMLDLFNIIYKFT